MKCQLHLKKNFQYKKLNENSNENSNSNEE